MKIAVVLNCLGAVVGALEREKWGECDIVSNGDSILVFENGEDGVVERYSGEEFIRLFRRNEDE